MNHSVAIRIIIMVLLFMTVMPEGLRTYSRAEEDLSRKVILPYLAKDEGKKYEYLYISGGYYSIDNGCPAWGTANFADIRMIGDKMGEIVIAYGDGSEQRIPLIFGYTLWFYNNWQELKEAFQKDKGNDVIHKALRETLSLKGAAEGEKTCVLRIRLDGSKTVQSVKIESNPDKNGEPLFNEAVLETGERKNFSIGGVSVNASDSFWKDHTIDGKEPLPKKILRNLDDLRYGLMTFEKDYENVPAYRFSKKDGKARTVFSGNSFANIATGVVACNVKSILERVDGDGMMHTSYVGAPSWRYDGFGYWVENANSYYDSYYSRDGGRALMTLCEYGMEDAANRSVRYANGYMRYFTEQKLTIGGIQIPGHYPVVLNKPLFYSTVLVPQAGWATKYTKSAFGDEYQNIGNQETDGHGLMMMANYTVWKNMGSPVEWINENLPAIREGAEWIIWCLDHPELSFAKNGLLYAESEAGMMQYTLYCNVPCMLGLYGYAEMAEAAGLSEEAKIWKKTGDGLKAAIEKKFLRERTGKWSESSFGFYHDPVLTMLADYFGYDLSLYPDEFSEWIKASKRSYAADLETVAKFGYFGASGIGYNHSMITQNALLTDNMADGTMLTENLCRLSYAPRLPDSYIVPEGITYDMETGALRRQGDLGNLVQAAEALKVFDLIRGIGAVRDGVLTVLPRLPEGWNVDVRSHPVQNSDATADLTVKYPKDGMQKAYLKLKDSDDIKTVSFRFGPLPADTKYAALEVNGKDVPCVFSLSGDSAWVYVNLPNSGGEFKMTLLYSKDRVSLGTFPVEKGSRSGRKWLFALLFIVILFGTLMAACKKKGKTGQESGRVPGIVAEAPTWEPEEEKAKPEEFDGSRYIDLVRGNPDAKISASSTEGGNPNGALGPASCFDGNSQTRWSSEQHDVDGCYLRVDFGHTVRVNGVFVDEVTIWGKISDWEAQYLDENGEWVTILEEFGFSDGTYYGFGESTPETQSFRLLFHEGSSLAISLYEVRIMGENVRNL